MTLETLLSMIEKIEEIKPEAMQYEVINFENFQLNNKAKTVEIKVK